MGKPLISDAQMLAMEAAMLRLRTNGEEQGSPRLSKSEEPLSLIALLAATLLHLRAVDVLVTAESEPQAEAVLAMAQEATFSPENHASCMVAGRRAASVAAGHALAQARSTRPGDDAPVTVALLHGAPADLPDAMRVASEHTLPLLLVLQDGAADRSHTVASIPNVEVVRIDANDAVACCRVMQESLLRARNRWGSVVLQAVTLPGAENPLRVFQSHLLRRGLLQEA